MRTICVFVSLALLLTGCFTERFIMKPDLAPADENVCFYLNDGSYVDSSSGEHRRVGEGYRVSGVLVRNGSPSEQFDGLIHDYQIERFGIHEFDAYRTLSVAGVVALVVGGLAIAISQMKP